MSGKLIGTNGKNIRSYAAQLVAALRGRQLPEGITSEQDFKRELVFPAARGVAAGYPDIRVYTPPWHNERICGSHPASSAEAMEPGCPVCWKEMKKWGSVDVFGTRHTFDMAARDQQGTLAVEVKCVSMMEGKMPNGEIQRLFGQCMLAASRHDVVIGVCGHRGALNPECRRDESTLIRVQWLEPREVHMVFLPGE